MSDKWEIIQGDARKLCKPGAPVCMFIDWRRINR